MNKEIENYDVFTITMYDIPALYTIICEYCYKDVTHENKLTCIGLAKEAGFTIKDAGYDGTYNLCPDCTEGIT